MYNRCVFMGRIVNDLELKTTPSGTDVLTFRIAVERRYQADKENRVTDFFNVVAWRQTAQFISRFFSKGRMILVEGELQTREYEDKNGVKHVIVELIADNTSFTGERKDSGNVPPPPPPPPEPPQAKSKGKGKGSAKPKEIEKEDVTVETEETGDDYPF